MLFEQVYLLYIYILLFELAMVTVVAIALFVALVVTVRKLDSKKKHISVWSIEMHSIYLNKFLLTRHTLWSFVFYIHYTKTLLKSQ